jgi:hypothetical protein
VGGSFHFLDDQREPFGGSVESTGLVMVEDLRPPPGENAAQCLHLGYVVFAAAGDGLVDESGSIVRIVDQVDVTNRFFG